MVDKEGLVRSSLSLSGVKNSLEPEKSVLDQVLAIRALIHAAQVTKVSIYAISAIEIYYQMDFHLYRPQIRFYSISSPASLVSLPVSLEMVRSLTELQPLLPAVSHRQLSWILQPWLEGLKTLY